MSTAPAETIPAPAQPALSARRRAPASGVVERARIWFDDWALHSCGQDTHSWAAKIETIRRVRRCRP